MSEEASEAPEDPTGWKRAIRLRFPAHHLAYASGILLILGGASGSATSYLLFVQTAESLAPEAVTPLLITLRQVLHFVSTLGGTSVLIGGYFAEKGRPRFLCTLFISLGAGLGILGFLLDVFTLLASPAEIARYAASFFTGLSGLGAFLALAAQVRLILSSRGGVRLRHGR